MNGSTNPAGLERDAKIGDLRIQLCITDITHLANRFRWLVLATASRAASICAISCLSRG